MTGRMALLQNLAVKMENQEDPAEQRVRRAARVVQEPKENQEKRAERAARVVAEVLAGGKGAMGVTVVTAEQEVMPTNPGSASKSLTTFDANPEAPF